MSPQELTEFKARCQAAQVYGRQIANAAAYAAELETEAGPVALTPEVGKHSPAHLMALIAKVERVRSGAEPKASAPEPIKAVSSKKGKKAKVEEDADSAPKPEDVNQ